ncbi:DUF2793 domain-containing protein [Phaeovulum sp. NW3]|uniref:DUF2793 domain-containing protein n=1 Tax=Phaeovulum sp. NW3 TaxID=2934933 RepID=UPI0020225D5B|nr:DUF2793 domain-containing protein [Phaeovulum sp. NW3]MCL7464805.1 DUF2793 domain-containing protein [Phaeovulum sp. NW3]
MTETNRLALPLLQPAQAQKHVTVNEALARLDGLVNLVLQSVTQAVPPGVAGDGVCYGVPVGAVNAWSGQEGKVAIGTNGGWVFATPGYGWRGFVADQGLQVMHDGEDWVPGALTLSAHGAGLVAGLAEIDHIVTGGDLSVTQAIIPAGAMVIGVSGRVTEAIAGTLSGWRLGNPGAEDRFGTGLGLSGGSWVRGMLSAPMTFYAPEPLVLSAEGGVFAGGGRVRLAVHYLQISLPGL